MKHLNMKLLTSVSKILLLSLILAGCYTAKKATKQIAKAQAIHPEVVAGACISYYPTKDSIVERKIYLPGKVVTLPGKTITINCDSIVAAAKSTPSNSTLVSSKSVSVPCPPSTHQVDTFYAFKEKYQESSAKLKVVEAMNSVLAAKVVVAQAQFAHSEEKVSRKNKIILYLALGYGVFILGLIAKLYFKAFKPF
jgi:hypothetical protein